MPAQTKVDINQASREELIAIDGIGETMADAIIRYRKEKGPFKNVNDVDNVPGIGESRLEYIKESLFVSRESARSRGEARGQAREQGQTREQPHGRSAQSHVKSQPLHEQPKGQSSQEQPRGQARSSQHGKAGSHGGSSR